MIRRLILFCLLLIPALPAAAPAAPRKAAPPQTMIVPQHVLPLPVNKGAFVKLPRAASTVFIAEPEIASYQVINSGQVLVFGRAPGETSFFAMDESGTPFYSATISVQYDTSQMQAALQREFPSLTLKLTPAADGIIVSGDVPTPQVAANVIALVDSFVRFGKPGASNVPEAQSQQQESQSESDSGVSNPTGAGMGKGTLGARNGKVINRLRVLMPTQVNIRVRIAEVNRNLSEKLGFKWQYSKSGSFAGTSFMLGLADTPVTGGAISSLFSGVDFAGLVDALAEENMVSVLAEPNLSVVSGETASFLAGGQMPFPVANGNDNVSIEFKDFGVLLGVTPTILSANRISMRLRPEVSEPSPANGITYRDMQIPGFIVRRAETTVEVASGQSFAIGGLLQNSVISEVSKIPGLGDIPILGALARSTAFKRGETELVIIATAHIVEPTGNSLRTPNATIHVPGVFERFFLDSKPQATPGQLRSSDFVFY